jgi:short-subunit dehydrogenase
MEQERKKAIIIGTSSGIGRALARKLSAEGWAVGLTGRSLGKLQELQKELGGESYARAIDVRDTREAIHEFNNLVMAMHSVDLVIINAGVLYHNLECRWNREEDTIKVNVLGFAAIANAAMNYFLQKQSGCIVGISSVAGHRGSGRSSAYNASKAFMINYMEGLRQRLVGSSVRVIDIRPGFVDTDMVRGRKGLFGVVSTDQAAEDIFRAIQGKKRIVYVPAWWGILMWFLKRVPESLLHWGYRRYLAWDEKKSAS